MINLWNASYSIDSRGLSDLWWRGAYDPLNPDPICADAANDDYSGFDMGSLQFTGGPNDRPDQFDMLMANLDDRYLRGYRRMVLILPAGSVACQPYPASQWWAMPLWRRQWFAAVGAPEDPDTWGVAGWLSHDHADVEMSVYMGWKIGDPCSICHTSNAAQGLCPTMETFFCDTADWTTLWHPCPGSQTHAPSTTVYNDLCTVWQNIQPWREIGFKRFWLDASNGAASLDATEFREFANNPNFLDTYKFPVFGGELFPLGAPLPSGRHPIDLEEFDYAPWVILLNTAELDWLNGVSCPCEPPCPAVPGAHAWDLDPLETVREGALWPTALPKCGNDLHPDWDGLGPSGTPYPFERLRHIYDWYICKGFTFWQGDLFGQSGFAERMFGFGKIKPAKDFNGDGVVTQADYDDFQAQFAEWHDETCWYLLHGFMLTYYHADMNGDGCVKWDDWLAFEQLWNLPPPVPDEMWVGDPLTHEMQWNPNERWLPCPSGGGGGTSFGGPP